MKATFSCLNKPAYLFAHVVVMYYQVRHCQPEEGVPMHRRIEPVCRPHRLVSILMGCLAWGCSAQGATEDPRTIATLPMDLAAAREKWEITDATNSFTVAVVDDAFLGRKVLDIRKNTAKGKKSALSFLIKSKAPVSGSYAVEALVRFPAGSKSKSSLSCGTRGDSTNGAVAYVLEGAMRRKGRARPRGARGGIARTWTNRPNHSGVHPAA
jgi:hypothetical protein